ncbi:MAG: FlgD Ig-like domain [Verrucomicrobiota bacterium]|jgi:hypothetical protein
MLSKASLYFFLLLTSSVAAYSQESPTPGPSPTARSVRITFLPPPLDGTISLGIYDAKGKLVRVLQREADINEFDIGTDALSTTWDGKDDAGGNAPAGKYSAHGFVVADLKIDGVGFFFNDFVTNDDSLRVRRIDSVRLENNELHLDADLLGDEKATLICDAKQGAFLRKLPPETALHCNYMQPPNVTEVLDCAGGVNNTLWLIDMLDGGARREIKQFSKSSELLRRMAIPESEPQPKSIAASTTEDRIFVVEEGPHSLVNRVRALSLAGSKTDGANGAVSDWKTDFEKKIIEHRSFSIENGKPVPTNPNNKISPEKISVKLQPNPLLADARVAVELAVGLDEDGSFLKTDDGLPLCSISETPKLTRALLAAHGSNALDVFQDDGAVVEQFRVTGVDQMMSFDCGGFELK